MSDQPQRIQRKRTAGWQKPGNTVYVGRPSKWGNPFPVGMDVGDLPFIVAKHMTGELSGPLTQAQAAAAFAIWLERHADGCKLADEARRLLRGKDLACWCRPDEPCHADALLRAANS